VSPVDERRPPNEQPAVMLVPAAAAVISYGVFSVCRPQCLHGTYSQSSAPGRLARSTPSDLLEGSNREFQKSKISRFHDGPWWCASLALENRLAQFFKAYMHRWHIDAIAEHLEA